MKTALLVEDRDSGFLFLDPDNAPEGAMPMEFTLEKGVLFSDVEDDNKVVWLATDSAIRVVPRESVDFDSSFEKEWPVPSATICVTAEDYEAFLATIE